MSQVIGDPEVMDAFRNTLIAFDQTLRQDHGHLKGAWAQAREHWDDYKAREFEETFEEVSRGIETYLAKSESFETHLLLLIQQLEGYGGVSI